MESEDLEELESAPRYPFDYESLHKGSFINATELENLFEVKRIFASYAYHHAAACRLIEREILNRTGEVVCARKKGPHIRILTDEETAVEINERMTQRAKGLRRDLNFLLHVDTEGFSHELKSKHARNLVVRGAEVLGMAEHRKQATAMVYKRNTPGILKPEE